MYTVLDKNTGLSAAPHGEDKGLTTISCYNWFSFSGATTTTTADGLDENLKAVAILKGQADTDLVALYLGAEVHVYIIDWTASKPVDLTRAVSGKPGWVLQSYKSHLFLHSTEGNLVFATEPKLIPGREVLVVDIRSMLQFLCEHISFDQLYETGKKLERTLSAQEQLVETEKQLTLARRLIDNLERTISRLARESKLNLPDDGSIISEIEALGQHLIKSAKTVELIESWLAALAAKHELSIPEGPLLQKIEFVIEKFAATASQHNAKKLALYGRARNGIYEWQQYGLALLAGIPWPILLFLKALNKNLRGALGKRPDRICKTCGLETHIGISDDTDSSSNESEFRLETRCEHCQRIISPFDGWPKL